MANLTVSQIILDAQRMASRVKDLDALGNALLVGAEGNSRQLDSMRQFQDDMDSLNRLSRDKSNSDMINRINQQNPSIREIRQENRELKACLEDHQRTLEIVMKKYREQMQEKIFTSRINFKEMYNENLSNVIREQSEKIHEMATVMQHAAAVDDNQILNELQLMTKLKRENETLREMLQISNQFGSAQVANRNEDKAVQTELSSDDSREESELNNTVYEVVVDKPEDSSLDCSQDSQIPKSPERSPVVVAQSTSTPERPADNNNGVIVDNANTSPNNNSLSNGEITSTTADDHQEQPIEQQNSQSPTSNAT